MATSLPLGEPVVVPPRPWNCQAKLTQRMWTMLMEWVDEVCREFKLQDRTFFLVAETVAAFIGQSHHNSTGPENFQLLGAAALQLVCNLIEVRPPVAHDFVVMTQYRCTAQDILTMAFYMLQSLQFHIMDLPVLLDVVSPTQWAAVRHSVINGRCYEVSWPELLDEITKQ